MRKILSKVFTEQQINMLLSPNKSKTRWSADDIDAAISLRCSSPKGYRFVKYAIKIPLPSMSTIRRWIRNFDVSPGVLKSVINIMKHKGVTMSEMEKLTVLSFDEIHLSNLIDIEREEQKVYGPYEYCQVIMARGLFKKWKQPVYYDYDQPVTKDILLDVIKQLYYSGYTVVSVTCDLEPKNKEVWNELGVGLDDPDNCSFPHPCNENLQVYTFFDPSHLLKLLRNHFIDQGVFIDNLYLDKTSLEILVKLMNDSEINTCHKFNQSHLDCQGTERQRVKPAAQLFSNTVAKNLLFWGEKKSDLFHNLPWREVAAFIKTVNDWFDIFNNRNDFISAYSNNLIQQNATLHEMTEYMTDMRFKGHVSMIECQKGVLRSNASLQNLLLYLKVKYPPLNIKFLYTSRLNQDILENLFSYLRAVGATNDRPTE